jgi:hypothetical protein
MIKPYVFKITGYIKVTCEIIAPDIDSACKLFDSVDDFELQERDITEVEELGEHYAD